MYLKCHKKSSNARLKTGIFQRRDEKGRFFLKKKSLKVFSGIDWKEKKFYIQLKFDLSEKSSPNSLDSKLKRARL